MTLTALLDSVQSSFQLSYRHTMTVEMAILYLSVTAYCSTDSGFLSGENLGKINASYVVRFSQQHYIYSIYNYIKFIMLF